MRGSHVPPSRSFSPTCLATLDLRQDPGRHCDSVRGHHKAGSCMGVPLRVGEDSGSESWRVACTRSTCGCRMLAWGASVCVTDSHVCSHGLHPLSLTTRTVALWTNTPSANTRTMILPTPNSLIIGTHGSLMTTSSTLQMRGKGVT